MLPLLVAAAAIGAGRAIAGGIQSKRSSNTRKNLIGEAYRNSSEELGVRQRTVREGNEEGLVSRGMMGGGDATNTLAGQNRADLETQFGFEKRDLDFQRKEALAQNKADLTNGYLGAVAGGVQTAANVMGAFGVHPLTAQPQAVPVTTPSAIPSPGTVSNIGGGPTGMGEPGTPNYQFRVPSVSSAMGGS